MITYISSWARQVILAVIVAIILEMILAQNSKNTKYIKTIIGIYVMYVIIVPGLNLMSGDKVDFSNIDYEDYFTNSELYENMEKNIEKVEDNNFKETYELKLKQDIENKLNKKGFIISSIKLEIEFQNNEEYGTIKRIKVGISKKKQEEKEEKQISVNKINVGKEQIMEESNLSEEEESEIKEFLNQEYGINYENIEIT